MFRSTVLFTYCLKNFVNGFFQITVIYKYYIYIYIYIFFPPVFISIDQFFSYLFYYSVRDSLKGGRIDGCKGGWIEEGVEGWKIGKRRKKGKGMKG